MSDCSDSISLDMVTMPWAGQMIQTCHGPLFVTVCGDQEKPALITYPDLALDCASCYQGLFSCPQASSLLFRNFCVYHIDPPGHEIGAAVILSEQPTLSVQDLAEQVEDVCKFFGLHEVICLGVTAGAYILTLFALKNKERVQGLILVSPLCRSPSWTEWLYNKALVNLLYFWGMCNFVKETLLQRYFSQEINESKVTESHIVPSFSRVLDQRRSRNVMRFLQAIHERQDLTAELKNLRCRTLIFVGEQSPFYDEAIYINSAMDRRFNALVEVQACGSLVTEEQPHSMLVPIEYFLMGYEFYKPLHLFCQSSTPTSPLSPPCVSPELLSPESLGLKLKPIKTRVSLDEYSMEE
ncbi:hypothetical protein O6H91_22G060700 [Diphasiastrum complanatum]|uniref:Uncharacterized protein n=1 Tax=Diphasiastrum complanatum TaxID=34168 RepID=A0ACC2AHT1_DIPCM|nr:hypothetical protein O6H91_22G060700 [Diphasiastrum complanatum]